MILKEYENITAYDCHLPTGLNINDAVFLDIETTGFSREYSQITVIGLLCHRGSAFKLVQLFAQSAEDEPEMLLALGEYIKSSELIITYNGESFDIPFLKSKCKKYGISGRFFDRPSLDLYICAKEAYVKNAEGSSLKLKEVEKLLGIDRADMISGGEAVELYRKYLRDGSSEAAELILLHNKDDIENLPLLLKILHNDVNTRIVSCPVSMNGMIISRAYVSKSFMNVLCYIKTTENPSYDLSRYESPYVKISPDPSITRVDIKIPILEESSCIIVDTKILYDRTITDFGEGALRYLLSVYGRLDLNNLFLTVHEMIMAR